MQHAPAADRNKEPILKVLQSVLPADVTGQALEIASGTGQHVAYFAQSFKNLIWQPSDIDQSNFQSISAFIQHYKLQNVKTPIYIDITVPADQWKDGHFTSNSCDIIYNANMVHISPWTTSVGLFKAAGYLLKPNGFLFTYGLGSSLKGKKLLLRRVDGFSFLTWKLVSVFIGPKPYANNGVLEPESNITFDKSLKSKDPDWGIRDIVDLKKLAEANGIKLMKIVDMPANNKTLIWQKTQV